MNEFEEASPVITIDGPSGTGKGTICHRLADALQWHRLDSGAIYRVLALAAQNRGIPLHDVQQLIDLAHGLNVSFDLDDQDKITLDGRDVVSIIRTENCGQDASRIAVIPELRAALLARQRAFAIPPGLVTDGRDMGTVVFPDALLKIYLHASADERANRRYLQLKEKGFDVSLGEVVAELAKRDTRDSSRTHAPLKQAADAVFIDTTGLTIAQVFQKVLQLTKERLFR